VALEYTGTGDAQRSLALLWGLPRPGTRGPKQRLSVAQIAAAAIAVVDAEGLTALSMRRVARKLGVAAMTLYTYVPSKAELIDVMLDTIAAEGPLLDTLPGDWRARLTLWARAALESIQRHPWMLQVATSRPPMGPNGITWSDSALRALSNIGLQDREIVALISAVDGYIRGVAGAAVDAAQAEQRTGISEEQWYTAHAPLLEQLIDPARFPTISRFYYSGVYDQPLDQFEFGLQRLLDGVQSLLTARNSPA